PCNATAEGLRAAGQAAAPTSAGGVPFELPRPSETVAGGPAGGAEGGGPPRPAAAAARFPGAAPAELRPPGPPVGVAPGGGAGSRARRPLGVQEPTSLHSVGSGTGVEPATPRVTVWCSCPLS